MVMPGLGKALKDFEFKSLERERHDAGVEGHW